MKSGRTVGAIAALVAGGVLWLAPGQAGAQSINENFNGVTAPSLPAGWTVQNANGDTVTWMTDSSYTCTGNSAQVWYNVSLAMNDWLFTPAQSLSTGHTYTLTFNYRVAGASYPEMLTVYIGTSNSAASMSTVLIDLGAINNTTCLGATVTNFTVPAVGTYYIGFHGHSAANMWRLVVDDVRLVETAVPVELMSISVK